MASGIIISRPRAIRDVTKACAALTRTCATRGRVNRMVWEYYRQGE
ncbi:MAG: hypothetical protein OIN87_02295 [Candidatus Methanoperedens sp.]|nr:hypothetical protein [Candidatus Methanoperedens sp.]